MKTVLVFLATALSLNILSNDIAGEMVDGLREGVWTDYSSDGKVKRRGEYKAGKANGVWKWYNKENQLIADGNYLLDKREGIWNLFFKNSNKRLQLTYKEGQLDGIQKTFYQEGSTECVLGYKDNQLEGFATNYYRNGKPRGEVFYKKGSVSGESILLGPEGNVLMVGENKDGNLVSLRGKKSVSDYNFINCRIREFEEPINNNFYSKSKIKLERNINNLTYIPVGERSINWNLYKTGAFEDSYYPIKRYAPVYPRIALEQSIEGCVMVKYTVTKEGNILNPEVLWSVPSNIFDRATIRAAKKYRYRPQVANGQAVEVLNVKSIVVFKVAVSGKNMNYIPEGCD